MKTYNENAFQEEVPTIQEGEATPRPAAKGKKPRTEEDSFIQHFTAQYLKKISPTMPFVNKAIVYRNLAEPLNHYGLPRLKELCDIYFASDDKYYKSEKWNVLTLLSMRTLNKLEQ